MRQKYQNTTKYVFLASLAGFLFSFQISSASQITRENVVDLVNYSRVKEGMNVLVENSKLNQAAMEKAKDMIQNNYFAHTSPKSVTPWFWFEKNGYDYQFAGENLAINFENAEEEHEAWMESIDHKKNILNPKYHEIGVAVEKGVIDDRMAIVTVQMFGAREGSVAVLGQAEYEGSLDLLNRELESGPWSQLAFVKSPAKDLPIEAERLTLNDPAVKGFEFDPGYWTKFFEGLSALLLVAAVGANPVVFGWMVIRKHRTNTQDVVYPVKLSVIK